MATPSPGKMVSSTYSPGQKRRMDKLIGLKNSTGDDLDIQITSCLYHLGKNDVAQATKILEEVRRLMEASNSKVYILKLNEITMEILTRRLIGKRKKIHTVKTHCKY